MRSRRAAAVCVVLGWAALAWLAASADAGPTEAPRSAGATRPVDERAAPDRDATSAEFDAATELMSVDEAGAARAFVELAEREPTHPLAADALFTAARLLDEKLAEPGQAAALFARIVHQYPASRVALAAQRRVDELTRLLGDTAGHEAAAEQFRAALAHYDNDRADEALASVRALLTADPDWPGAPAALLWLAQVQQRRGEFAAAERLYAELLASYGSAPEAFLAVRGAAETATQQGAYARAYRYLEGVAGANPNERRGLADTRDLIATAELRHRGYLGAFALLGLAVLLLGGSVVRHAGSAAAIRAALRPSIAVIYLLPVFALLMWAALASHEGIAPAVGIIAAGGLGLTWLSGAALAVGPATRARVLAIAAISGLAALAVVYIALHRTRLIDLIVATVRFGPDV